MYTHMPMWDDGRTMSRAATGSGTYSIEKLVSEPGKVEFWESEGLGDAHGYESCAAASKAIRSLQPLANRDPAWAGVYRIRCGGDTAATVILTTRSTVPKVEKQRRHSRRQTAKTSSWMERTTGRRYGDAKRKVGPDTMIYSAAAWWSDSDPSMQAVALSPKRAESEIVKQMRESARAARDDGSYKSINAALGEIHWSGVHSEKLSTLAAAFELNEAIRALTEEGVWYPER